jgi:DNA-binding NtrC family response regulator
MAGNLFGKSILIIDDDVRMLHALEKVFMQEGASVTCFDLAVDAFKLLAARPGKFNLLITDFRMPFVSGAKTVSIVHNVLPELPIIVLTAFGDPETKTECLRKGATAFLEKPVEASHLLEVVAKMLNSQKAGETSEPTDATEIQTQ